MFSSKHIAQGMIFESKRSGIIHNFGIDVNRGYKYIEQFKGGFQCYIMNTNDFCSNIIFKLKNENNEMVSK